MARACKRNRKHDQCNLNLSFGLWPVDGTERDGESRTRERERQREREGGSGTAKEDAFLKDGRGREKQRGKHAPLSKWNEAQATLIKIKISSLQANLLYFYLRRSLQVKG